MNADSNQDVNLAQLVRTLLKLDSSALAALSPPGNGRAKSISAGLHEFMRLILERGLSLLWAPDDYTLRLHSDASANGLRYNWRIHNLVELFAWALIRMPRKIRGSGELALCRADVDIVHLPRKQNTSEPRLSVDQLVRVATALLQPDFDAIRDAPGPSFSSISIRAFMAETLGVQPDRLIHRYYDTQEAAERAFATDPEGQAAAGLSALLTRIIYQHPLILDLETKDCILRFKLESGDYVGTDGPAGANLGALLTAGLFADGTRHIGFVA